jgi:hypothetical protein
VGPAERREDQDERQQAECRRNGILGELQADIRWREPLGGNAGADNDGREQEAAEELGEQAASLVWRRDRRRRCARHGVTP